MCCNKDFVSIMKKAKLGDINIHPLVFLKMLQGKNIHSLSGRT